MVTQDQQFSRRCDKGFITATVTLQFSFSNEKRKCYYQGDWVINRVSEISGRVIRKEVKVNASIEKVWKVWTANDGATTFFAPKARIELTLGGRYELYFGSDQS